MHSWKSQCYKYTIGKMNNGSIETSTYGIFIILLSAVAAFNSDSISRPLSQVIERCIVFLQLSL